MDVLCFLFFFIAALQDGGLLEINELFFINGVVDGASGERFLTITFCFSSVKYRVYFLVVCIFFARSRIDFQKNLDEKHKKQTSCPYSKRRSVHREFKGEVRAICRF